MSYVTPMRAVLLLTFLASAQALSCQEYTKSGGGVISMSQGPIAATCSAGETECMSYYYQMPVGTGSSQYTAQLALGGCYGVVSCDDMKTVQSSAQPGFDESSWECMTCSTDNCNTVYDVSSSFGSDASNALTIIIVIICVVVFGLPLCICGICFMCGMGCFAAGAAGASSQQAQQPVQVIYQNGPAPQMGAIGSPGAAPPPAEVAPPGGIYQKNGVWVDKDGNSV